MEKGRNGFVSLKLANQKPRLMKLGQTNIHFNENNKIFLKR